MEKRDLFFVALGNVWNNYILGRIIGMIDIKANLSDSRQFKSWAIQEIDEGGYVYPVESTKELLNETIEEIKKFCPFAAIHVLDSKELEES